MPQQDAFAEVQPFPMRGREVFVSMLLRRGQDRLLNGLSKEQVQRWGFHSHGGSPIADSWLVYKGKPHHKGVDDWR